MTEYDYSSDAYNRYLATQRRIARWTEETSRYRPSNPFVTSPHEAPLSRSTTPRDEGSHRGSRSRESSQSRSRRRSTSDAVPHRPEPSRSYTAPTVVQRGVAEHSSRSRSTHHSRHLSRSNTSHHTASHATASQFKTVIPNANGPTYITPSNSQPILVPYDGGSYVIVPPRGTRLEVMDRSYYTSAAHGRRKDTKSEKPLIKRLFSGISSIGKRE